MSLQTNKMISIAPAVERNNNNGNMGNSLGSPLGKIKSEEETFNSPNGNSNGKNNSRKKRKVAIACVYCRRSHMICDDLRPCQRCLKRNIGHLCHDEPVSTRERKKLAGRQSESPQDGTPNKNSGFSLSPRNSGVDIPNGLAFQTNTNPAPAPALAQTQTQTQTPQQLSSSLYLNQQPVFFSEHAGSEFSSLNEFLSMIDDPEFLNNMNNDPILQNIDTAMSSTNSAVNLNLFETPMGLLTKGNRSATTFSQLQSSTSISDTMNPNFQQQQPLQQQQQPQVQQHQQQQHHAKISSTVPVITDNARDKFFLTAADPTTEISPEERLKQVINAKLEAGLLKPYNYAEGYARLQRYMDSHMNPSSRQRILKPLSVFRPAFRAIAKTLKDIDLMLVEESFERMLLDYDRVFTSMAIPACLWRRSGEIYRGNKEFASLVEVNIDDLKNGQLTIYELMSEESSVNFWEKYGSIAFDKTQKAVLTSCKLKTKDGRKKKNCCFSFTIRRDRYNIPSCIVGNFIPIAE